MEKASLLAALLAAFALSPSAVIAQEQSECGIVIIECGPNDDDHNFNEHWLEERGPDEEGTGTFHGECLRCVRNGQYVEVTECHPLCSPDEEDQEEFGALLEAAYGLDEASLLRATLELPQYASLNLERGSVQVLGCGDLVIANVPIDEEVIQAFQEEFPRL